MLGPPARAQSTPGSPPEGATQRPASLEALLVRPETAFDAEPRVFEVRLDNEPLNFNGPEVLFAASNGDAAFIAGAWKNAAGKIVHQREVLIVKAPGYEIVADHLYGSGQHDVSWNITGKGMRYIVRHLGPSAALTAATQDSPETYRLTLPCPFASALCSELTPAPKFEYVKPANAMIVKCKVTLPEGRVDEVGIAWESRDLHLGGKAFKGWAAVAREGPGATGDIEIK